MRNRYVKTEDGTFLIQAMSRGASWGFYLADDDQTWGGGFGIASRWVAIQVDEVPADVRERLGHLEDWDPDEDEVQP